MVGRSPESLPGDEIAPSSRTAPRAMEGIRVLEVALYAFVPAAGAILAEWGAEVVKVEHPEHGDPMRGTVAWGIEPGTGGFTYMWEVCNRGKRAIGVNLAHPEGRELVLRMCEDADVFLTNFLPAARKRLGIDVDDVMARNPRIIYGRGSGQGPAGPDAEQGGFDGLTYWARSGAASAATPPDDPWPAGMPGPGFGDVQSGMALAGGIAAALFRRERTGSGAVVDVSLLSTGLWAMQPTVVAAALVGVDDLPHTDHFNVGNPLTNSYRTADGRVVALGMLEGDRYWAGFCELAGRPDLATDPRFTSAAARGENSKACIEALDELFAERPLSVWKALLARQEGQWTVVQMAGEVAHDPQAVANRYVQDVDYGEGSTLRLVSAPVQIDGTPGLLTPAPEHGAHTEEVLLEMGCNWDRIVELKELGAIN